MVFDAVCIILNITEIVLFAKKKLAPITYLVLQVVKTSIWTIVFIVYIVRLATIQGTEGYYIDGFDLFLGGDIEAIVLLYVNNPIPSRQGRDLTLRRSLLIPL